MVVNIQLVFKEHLKMQQGRRKVLKFFWEVERLQAMTNNKHPSSKAYQKQNEQCVAVLRITDEIRDAVLEKWLTYAKTDHLNEIQLWRLCLLDRGEHFQIQNEFIMKNIFH